MALADVCREIRNWFVAGMYFGEFTISNGQISSGDYELQDGQYFRIVGSIFNDGVYKYPATELTDETFDGAIWAMAVPPAVIAISEEIDAYVEKYGAKINSPYQSESFAGYSYSKASGGSSSGGSGNGATWQSVFASRLNKWRKIR